MDMTNRYNITLEQELHDRTVKLAKERYLTFSKLVAQLLSFWELQMQEPKKKRVKGLPGHWYD